MRSRGSGRPETPTTREARKIAFTGPWRGDRIGKRDRRNVASGGKPFPRVDKRTSKEYDHGDENQTNQVYRPVAGHC